MTLKVGLVGFGEVGRALAQRLPRHAELRVVALADRSGGLVAREGVDVAAACERKLAAGSLGGDPRFGPEWIARAADVDVLVDLLPTDLRTGEPSFSLQSSALRRGVSVVAAGKGPLALHEAKLRVLTSSRGASYSFSAAVCGGTPILELVGSAFRGDRVERFEAVLNGSTNHILTLLERGEKWEDAVADARARGILEADPSLDLLGIDAAAKAVILSNQIWRPLRTLSDVRVQGIMGVTTREAQEAAANGLAIRLVARASAEGVSVAPVALSRDHPLAVEGKENAVRLKLADAGPVVLRGAGAGGPETASAVLSDLLRMADGSKARFARATPLAPHPTWA